jgi:predicted hotdog family 3-hydroxylacyl-ACP dehydratase
MTQLDIRRLLPHAGAMCLLEAVLAWDPQSITCLSLSHHAPDNPLRGPAGLSSANGIEYAAQAMALHAALVGGAGQRRAAAPTAEQIVEQVSRQAGEPVGKQTPHGVLASVRAVQLHVPRLDVFTGELRVRAVLLSGDPRTAIYAFSVLDGERALLDGRASVLFSAQR